MKTYSLPSRLQTIPVCFFWKVWVSRRFENRSQCSSPGLNILSHLKLQYFAYSPVFKSKLMSTLVFSFLQLEH